MQSIKIERKNSITISLPSNQLPYTRTTIPTVLNKSKYVFHISVTNYLLNLFDKIFDICFNELMLVYLLLNDIYYYVNIILKVEKNTQMTTLSDWLYNVTAIFKNGERYRANNYRPVSLTGLCCKVQEHIIISSILKHLDAHHILTDLLTRI